MADIIKEFAEFQGPQDTSNWKIMVSSHTEMNGLTKETIEKLMDLYHHEEYQDFINRSDRTIIKGVDDHPTAIWQVNKMREFETKFFDNLKYEIEDGILHVYTEFEVKVTKSFGKQDVIEWTEGFSRLCAIHPMTYMRKPKLDDTYQEEKPVLQQLKKNEKIKVEKLS